MRIAVIGCAGVFPQAPDLEAFGRNLREGRDSVRRITQTRRSNTTLPLDGTYPEFAFIEDIHSFDHGYFGLSRGEANNMDPHHRLILQSAVHAIESAQVPAERLRGTNTAVYVAEMLSEYITLADSFDPTQITGNLKSAAAGRLARFFDFRGRAMVVDTACSSGLVAIEMACRDLARGDADYALVAAANLRVMPKGIEEVADIGIFSPTFRARSYSDAADGTGGGEVVATVLLQRLDDATDHGNPVHVVVRGAAVNQDAARSGSLTAPDAGAQAEVITAAWSEAGVDPRAIRVIEGHGSGTKLGDPIELQGLTKAFRTTTQDTRFCALSSVKSNIGHTDSAAGLVGFIKAVLSVKRREIYPAVHFDKPNAMINFDQAPVYVATEFEQLSEDGFVAGVSSFGLSGTNCHVVLESPPAPIATPQPSEAAQHLFPVSAADREGLLRNATTLRTWIADHPDVCLHDLSRVLVSGRAHLSYRLCPHATSVEELVSALDAAAAALTSGQEPARASGSFVFCFSEAETLSAAMLQELRQRFPEAERACEDAAFVSQDYDNSGALGFMYQYALAKVMAARSIAFTTVVSDGTGARVVRCLHGECTPAEGLEICRTADPAPPLPPDRVDRLLRNIGPRAVLVEVGPSGHVSKAVEDRVAGRRARTTVQCLSQDEPVEAFLSRCYIAGAPLDPDRRPHAPALDLPGYAFAETRCWLHPPHPIGAGSISVESGDADWIWSQIWSVDAETSDAQRDFSGQVVMVIAGDAALTGAVTDALRDAGAVPCVVGGKNREATTDVLPHGKDRWTSIIDDIMEMHGALDGVVSLADYLPLLGALTPEESRGFLQDDLTQALALIQSLTDRLDRRVFWLTAVTAHAAPVLEGECANPHTAMSSALFRSTLSEYVELDLRCVDLSYDPDKARDQAQAILSEIAGDGLIRFVACRDGTRYSPILQPIKNPPVPVEAPSGGTIILTGGAGGLGLAMARHLASYAPHRFILLGRRPAGETDQDSLDAIRATGSRVEYFQIDLADSSAVQALFQSLAPTLSDGFGIIHAAGVAGSWTQGLHQKSPGDFVETCLAKVVGTLNLQASCEDLDLRYFHVFSSLSVLVPPRHRADYACANAFLDAYARAPASTALPATCITWPAWDDFTMGMYDPATLAGNDEVQALLSGLGFGTIDTATGLRLFDRIPALPGAQTIFARVNRQALAFNPYFRFSDAVVDHVMGAPPPDASVTEVKVWHIWGGVLLSPDLGLDDDFYALGGHSLIAVRILHLMRKDFDCNLQLKDILTAPTIRQFAALIDDRLSEAAPGDPAHAAIEPAPDSPHYPVATAQSRIWLASQARGAAVAYNEPSAYRLSGDIDLEALRDPVHQIIERHEILRTSFEVIDGAIRQIVHETLDLEDVLTIEDVSGVADPRAAAMDRVQALSVMDFDLARTPLVAFHLMKVGADEAVVGIVSHHIISDGWSHKIFLDELMALSGPQAGGGLAPLALQYRDYAVWDTAQADRHAQDLAFWRLELAGIAPTFLPLDKTRPEERRFLGERLGLELSGSDLEALSGIARDKGVSLYAVLLGLISALLYRWSGREEFVIASPVSGRDRPELAPLIGCFVNLLCLRLKPGQAATLGALIDGLAAHVPQWMAHAECPYDLLVEDDVINPDRRFRALYEVGFTWDSDERDSAQIGEVDLKQLPVRIETAKASLWFYGRQISDRLQFEVEYDTDLFARETMELLLQRFRFLLTHVSDHMDAPLATLSLQKDDPANGPTGSRIKLDL